MFVYIQGHAPAQIAIRYYASFAVLLYGHGCMTHCYCITVLNNTVQCP